MRDIHQTILGDALKILPTIPEESVDLVFADPPYNLARKKGLGWKFSKHVTLQEEWDLFSKDDFLSFNRTWIQECVRVLKPGGSFWVCGSFHNIYQLGFILQSYSPQLRVNNSIVWFKPNAQPNITCRMFTESTEHLIWATKERGGTKWKFNYQWTKDKIQDPLNPKGKQTRNVWHIPVTPRNEKSAGAHPTQKPLELLRRIVLSCTDPGDIVLDPFAGSGTTGVVARRYGRHSMAIERDRCYHEIARKRFDEVQRIFGN